MKIFGKWLVIQQRCADGKKAVITSGATKKSVVELLDSKMSYAGPNLWMDEDSIFWVEKNTKEYR